MNQSCCVSVRVSVRGEDCWNFFIVEVSKGLVGVGEGSAGQWGQSSGGGEGVRYTSSK